MTPTAGHRRKANDRYDHESICRHPGVWFTINSPGAEIETALVGRILNVPTPFGVEFGRSSIKRNGAPTLVPVQDGGSPVLAQILLVNISEGRRVGQSGHYIQHENPGPNTLVIDRYENFGGVGTVIAARFAVTISPPTAVHLAELAIKSARLERTGRDGITYLIDAKRNGIVTPLSVDYEQEILRRTQTSNLHEALRKIQTNA